MEKTLQKEVHVMTRMKCKCGTNKKQSEEKHKEGPREKLLNDSRDILGPVALFLTSYEAEYLK